MKIRLFAFAVVALLCCAAPSLANTVSICDGVANNLVQNCGFELGNFNGWTVLNNDGNTAVEGQNFGATGVNSGNFFAALGDAASQPTTIEQTISDLVNTTLTFSFYLATDGTPDLFMAQWDGTTLLSLTNAPQQGYTQYSFTVTGSGSDTISFIEQDQLGYMGLDDVVVLELNQSNNNNNNLSSAPEPSNLAFVVVALGLIAKAHQLTKKTAN